MSDITQHGSLDDAALALPGGARAADFIELLKPRVMSLVVFTGLVGMALAPGQLHPVLAAVAVLCIAVGAGASGAINMWYDRDIDAIMSRTKRRPIPSGRVDADEALAFGVFLSAASVVVMGMAVNWVAAFLLAFTIAFYIGVYTIGLKRRTPQNIVIGGAAGAFPPMIGWAAVTGGVDWASVSLFALIFLWTPPHFWSLALFRCRDYTEAGVPMMPVVAGERATKVQMLIYTLVLLPAAAAPWALGVAGPVYLAGAMAMGALFVACAVAVLREPDGEYRAAKRMFGFSLLHLFTLFALMLGERLIMGVV